MELPGGAAPDSHRGRRSVEELSTEECVDVLRLIVMGYLSPALFHEIWNIVTVVNGIRQASELAGGSQPIQERFSKLIADQVGRSAQVSSIFRSVSPEAAQLQTAPTLELVRDEVAAVIEVRARGRRVRVSCAGEGKQPLEIVPAYRAKLAFLGATLALLDQVFVARAVCEITLSVGEGPERGAWLEWACVLKGRGSGASRWTSADPSHASGITVALACELASRLEGRLDPPAISQLGGRGDPGLLVGTAATLRLVAPLLAQEPA
ncbi:MAG: hypothetical protein AB1486_02535 [Planctomycetota bacterium]